MAAPILQLKRGTTAPGSIFYEAQPVYNTTGKILYLGDAGGTGTGAGSAVASASTYAASAEILVKSVASTSAGQVLLKDAQASQNTLTVKAPATVTASYSFTLPAAVPASATGYFMTSNTSGDTSWSQIGISAVTGLGTNVATFLATPSAANLLSAVTEDTGTGSLVFATSPSLTTPSLSGETFSTTNNVTAGTNTQGQGALTTDYNVITTAAASPSGVTLPTATQGRRIVIVNKGANAINVYPATGGTIDALALNASISIPVGGVMVFNASSTTQWYSSFNSSISGTGVSSFSAGTTGLTPSTGTTGAVTLAGTLAVANGGTGASTAGITAFNNISGYSASGATGTTSTNLVFSTSPTLTTPVITTSVTTGSTSFDLLNTTATTVNFAGAATTLSIGASTGTTTVNNNLTVTGNLTVSGTTTILNTQTIQVEDRFIELGLVAGAAPSSATTWDTAIGFNYFATSAKKSGIVWLDNTGFTLASELAIGSGDTGTTAADPQLTVTTLATLAVNNLYIGALGTATNEVITAGATKTIINVTIDCGTY
jgi:hypothetical protein